MKVGDLLLWTEQPINECEFHSLNDFGIVSKTRIDWLETDEGLVSQGTLAYVHWFNHPEDEESNWWSKLDAYERFEGGEMSSTAENFLDDWD